MSPDKNNNINYHDHNRILTHPESLCDKSYETQPENVSGIAHDKDTGDDYHGESNNLEEYHVCESVGSDDSKHYTQEDYDDSE